ncbi:DUF5937 family protein [Nonomuraea diastatica]|uniref:DUF5937 domain-containing protein n=1 Tax=Nonomuraea diastatica TaxID=1848329 RepID=A0A4R4X2P6_9ACTN|nr:DUF5937 family protein [Nonomuraea diastatica]TDD24469.1 hypothetical protein E1294_05770 [Nonomuraea diastatica]
MTLRLRLPDTETELAAFGCSPAHEMTRSLNVLQDVKRHPLHISWALRARARMSSALKEETHKYGFWYTDKPLTFPEIWPVSDASSWPEELTALREAPVEQFAAPLIHAALLSNRRGPRISHGAFARDEDLRERALSQIEAVHPASVPVMHELTTDPERVRERFAAFLSSYWDACIAPDWPRLEARLLADITRRGRALSRRGLTPMLEELSPHVRPDPGSGEIVIQPPRRRNNSDPLNLTMTEHDQIVLVPSHFVWPELVSVVNRQTHRGGVGRPY